MAGCSLQKEKITETNRFLIILWIQIEGKVVTDAGSKAFAINMTAVVRERLRIGWVRGRIKRTSGMLWAGIKRCSRFWHLIQLWMFYI